MNDSKVIVALDFSSLDETEVFLKKIKGQKSKTSRKSDSKQAH